MNGEQMYMQTRGRLVNMLNSQQIIREFGRKADAVRHGCDVMISQLDLVLRGKRVVPNDSERSAVATATNAILEKVVYDPIDRFTADFAMLFAEIAKNWNQKIGYQYDMDIWVDTIARVVQQHLTIVDAINILRQLLNKCVNLLNYEPPAFTLSKHYLKVIEDKMEKGEAVNEYEKEKT